MSATSLNMSSAECATLCLVSKTCIGSEACLAASRGLAGSLETGEVLGGVIRGPRQRARRNEQKAPRLARRAQRPELLRRHEALNRGMLAGRLEILADREEVDAGRAQVIHQREHLGFRLAETDHDAGLGEYALVELFRPQQQPQGMLVTRAGADAAVERRHGLEIVIEHVGP